MVTRAGQKCHFTSYSHSAHPNITSLFRLKKQAPTGLCKPGKDFCLRATSRTVRTSSWSEQYILKSSSDVCFFWNRRRMRAGSRNITRGEALRECCKLLHT